MKVLLDECIPRKFKECFVGHACSTVPEAGFAGERNGELLSLAEQQGFEVFLTLDKGIQYQQNLTQSRSQLSLSARSPTGSQTSSPLQRLVFWRSALSDPAKSF
jgi:hypothetical protein